MLPILLVLASCTDPRFSEAKEAVAHNLKDPASTQFRDLKICPSGNGVQGEFNSKNGYGAYEGFKSFIFFGGQVGTIDTDNFDADRWTSLMKTCYGKYFEGGANTAEADNIEAAADDAKTSSDTSTPLMTVDESTVPSPPSQGEAEDLDANREDGL